MSTASAFGFGGLSSGAVEQVALAFEATGVQSLIDTSNALAQVDIQITQLSQDLNNGVITLGQFNEATRGLVREQTELRERLAASTYAMKSGVDSLRAVSGDGEKSINRLTNSAFQLAFALDDVQYGLQGITNNLPGIIGIFTPSGPIGAGAAAGATALALYAQHWEKLSDLFVYGATNADSASVALQKNAEAAVAARVASEQLVEAKRQESVMNTLLSLQSTEERERQKLVKKAIGEAGGGDDVRSLLVQSFQADGTGARDPKMEKFIDDLIASGQWEGGAAHPFVKGKIDEMNKQNAIVNMARAERLMREALESEEGLTALRNRVMANPNVFGNTNLAMDLGEASVQGQFDKAVREQRIIERNEERKRTDREQEQEKRRAEREQEQLDRAREQAERQLEQTEVGRTLSMSGVGAGILGANKTVADAFKREGKADARGDKAEQRQVEAEAREFIPDFASELGGAFAGRLARGQSAERAQQELVPQIVRRLQNSASFDQTLDVNAVAARIAAEVAADVGSKIAAQQNVHGPQGAASAVAREMQQDAARKAQREGNADRRDAEQQFAAQQAALAQAQLGANPQQAERFGQLTVNYMKRGFDLAASQQAAYADLTNQVFQLGARLSQLEANQQRAMMQGRTLRGNFLRNRFPR